MRPTCLLWQKACRITLFTRQDCSLCEDAKRILRQVWEKRPYEFDEIDVMAPSQERWKAAYEFDTPVIHVEEANENDHEFRTTTEAMKLMHRFQEQEVVNLMNKVMQVKKV